VKLTELTVRHPQVTLVLVALLVALGVNAIETTPRAEDPSFPLGIFSVVAVYPGATPRDVEQLIVDPIEKSLSDIDHIKRIRSRAENGVAITTVEFEAGVDVDAKHDAVIRQVEATRAKLPSGVTHLDVKAFSTTNVAILQLALVSESAPYRSMQLWAEELTRRLGKVPGVKEAEGWAYPEQEVRVSLDLERLTRLGLSVNQVLGVLQAGDARIPGGDVTHGGRTLSVETRGGFRTVDEIRDTVIGASPGQSLLRLGDVAEVRLTDAERTYLGRFNGKRAVFVTVTQRDKQNVFDVRDRVMVEVNAFASTLPPGTSLALGFDQSGNVAHRLGGLTRDFAFAIALVLVTLLPLGWRASVIVMLSIPLSLALGLTWLQLTGYTLNQLSIVGFVIALGLLVDDSIVVTENITRFRRLGHSRDAAAVLGTRQIGVAVIGCTATLLFAFLPLIFLPGSAGDFIRSMPMAVVYTIVASLFVSLTIIPFAASRLLPERPGHDNWAYRLMSQGIDRSYRPVLGLSLGHPGKTLLAAGLLVAGALALVPRIGFSLFPKAGTRQFLIKIQTADGASLETTDRAARHVEAVLAREPNVKTVMTNVGKGNPLVYYNLTPASASRNAAELFVELVHYDPSATPAWMDRLRATFARYPGARIEVSEFENGPPVDAPVAVRLIGRDLESLRAQAARVEELLAALPGTRDVDNPLRVPRTDLRIEVDRDEAGLLGIPPGEIERDVRLALVGLKAATLREPSGDERDVIVTLAHPASADAAGLLPGLPTLDTLDHLYVAAVTGTQIPFSQVARPGLVTSPSFIQRENRERAVTVTAQVRSGFNTDRVTHEALARLTAMAMPTGVRWVAAGEIESRQESFGGLGTAVLIAAFGILSVLVLEFKTFKSTLIVASVIPLGVMGGLVALFLSGNTLSFTAVVGFIALIGIEVKNSILLVDFTNQLRAEGVALDQAIARAGQTRFFPVLLTSLTAVGGLVPLALQGSSLYSPLALVIIGGLVSSTVLSRLVTPVVYKLLPPTVAGRSVDARDVHGRQLGDEAGAGGSADLVATFAR
jgi:multidrug efflux pump subunit AcrB